MILVTGGTGYLGSHAAVALATVGRELVILDNLCNSSASVIGRLKRLCARDVQFVEGDVRDTALLAQVFLGHDISAVMHFAGLKAVGESTEIPVDYYDNNVNGTIQLLVAMRRAKVKTLVFSSSATVYGDPARLPITEDCPFAPTSPYGRSKVFIEEILADLHHAEPDWRIARLRYFNPVGAHESGLIGEDPTGIPNNLMPFVAQVALGSRSAVNVFGTDYPTRDGSGVRDYIHVMDLAEGHVAALDHLEKVGGLLTVNLGTGQGHSVLEVVKAFERASNRPIPCLAAPRRKGDVAQYWADPSLANRLLHWQAERSLHQMCADTWRWQMNTADTG